MEGWHDGHSGRRYAIQEHSTRTSAGRKDESGDGLGMERLISLACLAYGMDREDDQDSAGEHVSDVRVVSCQ